MQSDILCLYSTQRIVSNYVKKIASNPKHTAVNSERKSISNRDEISRFKSRNEKGRSNIARVNHNRPNY